MTIVLPGVVSTTRSRAITCSIRNDPEASVPPGWPGAAGFVSAPFVACLGRRLAKTDRRARRSISCVWSIRTGSPVRVISRRVGAGWSFGSVAAISSSWALVSGRVLTSSSSTQVAEWSTDLSRSARDSSLPGPRAMTVEAEPPWPSSKTVASAAQT